MKPLVFAILVAALALPADAQQKAAQDFNDPIVLLQAVAKNYASAVDTFRMEWTTDSENSSDLSRSWNRTNHTAINGAGSLYRIEVRTAYGSLTQVSDGENEWIYQPERNSYVKRLLPPDWPKFPKVMDMTFSSLSQTWNRRTWLEAQALEYKRATMLPDEAILIGGHRYPCYVVRASSEDSTGNHDKDNRDDVTFWIGKQDLVFRKIRTISDGYMTVSKSLHLPSHFETTETYSVVEIDPATTAEMFRFTPPADAKEVATLEPDFGVTLPSPHPKAAMVGQMAPDVTFNGADGKKIKLSSYRGKPLLIDFWATWCGPCIVSMPALGRIYSETKDKGLQVIGFDQSTAADDSALYLKRHHYGWTNYHDDDKAVYKALKGDGIPLMVLIDSQGKIVYYDFGGDERELRKVIASLGPEFASVASSR